MTDHIMAVFALIMLVAFLSVIPFFVPHPDLIILVVGCMVLAGYDVWRHIAVKRS